MLLVPFELAYFFCESETEKRINILNYEYLVFLSDLKKTHISRYPNSVSEIGILPFSKPVFPQTNLICAL